MLPDTLDRWLPRPIVSLGTDGFGRSESRADLRNHFEVDARFVVVATLSALARDEAARRQGRAAGDQGSGDQPGEDEPGDGVATTPTPRRHEATRLRTADRDFAGSEPEPGLGV